MKIRLSEKNLVVLLFALVLISFGMAQENTREVESAYTGKVRQATLPGQIKQKLPVVYTGNEKSPGQ